MYSIHELNQMNHDAFVVALGAIFEETPSIAHHAWYQRPFTDITELHQTMVTIMRSMSLAEQLALIQAHPDLGSRTKMAEASVQEQAGAGLNQLSSEEYEQFQMLNQAYQAKFGFPFVIAVKNRTKLDILHAFKQRLGNTVSLETEQALIEISEIAKFRLMECIQ